MALSKLTRTLAIVTAHQKGSKRQSREELAAAGAAVAVSYSPDKLNLFRLMRDLRGLHVYWTEAASSLGGCYDKNKSVSGGESHRHLFNSLCGGPFDRPSPFTTGNVHDIQAL